MRSHLSSLALTFALAFGLAAGQARAQQIIEISGANFRPLPLAVAAPLSDPAAREDALKLDEALLFDLTASGLFRVLDRKGFLAGAEGMDAASIKFNRWVDVGADVLAKVQVTRAGGQVRAELRLYNVGSAKEELKQTEAREPREVRRIAHAFADAIYRHYTREPGAFQTRIAFVKKGGAGRADVWMADWDGHGAFPVTSGGLNILPAVTPDGVGVAFTSYRRGRPELFAQRAGGAAQPLVSAGQMVTGATYSPDGRQIAYSVADGESAQLWVAGADGSSPRQLTSTPYTLNTSPSWSPDGKQLAFVSNRGGSPQIYVMSAAGGDAKRLTFQGSYNQTPDWSPRGDLIAFTARDERNAFDLFTVNVETRKIARLTQDTGNNEEPSFSPNGRMIVFTSTRNGSPQLFVMTADGQNQLPLAGERGACVTPDWGPLAR